MKESSFWALDLLPDAANDDFLACDDGGPFADPTLKLWADPFAEAAPTEAGGLEPTALIGGFLIELFAEAGGF